MINITYYKKKLILKKKLELKLLYTYINKFTVQYHILSEKQKKKIKMF